MTGMALGSNAPTSASGRKAIYCLAFLDFTHRHPLPRPHASRVAKGTLIQVDESNVWDDLHARYEMKRINIEEAYSSDGACTNEAESFFSRMRSAEIGYHIAGAWPYLLYDHCCGLKFVRLFGARLDSRKASTSLTDTEKSP